MARQRFIRPEFFQHGELHDAEAKARLPLRLALSGLWCHADSDGRFPWRPRELKLGILPYDDLDFGAVLMALEAHGFIWREGDYGVFTQPLAGHLFVASRDRAPIPQTIRDAIFARDEYRCRQCGSTNGLQIDHIHPWSRGGSNEPDNLQLLCSTCNQSKGASF